MNRVLVAYATVYGSTQEVAEAIATELGEAGLHADARPAREVKTLEGYAGVVLGAPLYYFRWHRDARRFLSRHLATLPVAVYALGPFNDVADEFDEARKELDRALGEAEWLSPMSIQVFGGRFDPALLRFPHKVPGLTKMPVSDVRNWEDIRAWSAEIAGRFR